MNLLFLHSLFQAIKKQSSLTVTSKARRRKLNCQQTFGIFLLSSLMPACDKPASHLKPELKSYVVQESIIQKKLHYSGSIHPLTENLVITPMEAVIETIHAHYGQAVKKDQILFTLNSAELQRKYNETLINYLKAKNSYHIARTKFTGTNELWKAGLLSKNNYINEKSSLLAERVAFMQASQNLYALFDQGEIEERNECTKLSLRQFDKVRLALIKNHNQIQLKSPSDGVLLYAFKSDDNTSLRVQTGMALKSGQVLGLIGDMQGIRVEIDIPEVDINDIKIGMKAMIHGIAFNKQSLNGRLVAVNAQATVKGNDGLPTFTAVIEVHGLSKEQQALIKVGMGCEIELFGESTHHLLVPIAAIKPENGHGLIQVLTKDNHVSQRSIHTGAVWQDKVVVASGLRAGDVVVYD
ncbi:MAG: efflux RND transporter periplasmic adaptor subunit [Legionellaceae bacterium]|nr:efflux RND transporter periplasmic adaptor subunit [Legionellaceae bacterium]